MHLSQINTLLTLLSGISLYAFINHFTLWVNKRKEKKQLIFSVLCLLIGIFILSELFLYNAISIDVYTQIEAFQLILLSLWISLFYNFIEIYINIRKRLFSILLYSYFAVTLPVFFACSHCKLHTNTIAIHQLKLPWGDTISKIYATPSIWMLLFLIPWIIVLAYGLFASFWKYKIDYNFKDFVLFISLLCLSISLIFDIFINNTIVDFIFSAEIAFAIFVGFMSWSLSRDLWKSTREINQSMELEISKRKETEYELRISEKKFRDIFNNSIDSIVITDTNQTILEVNDSFLFLIGETYYDIKNKKLHSFISENDKTTINNYFDTFIKHKSYPSIEVELQNRHGFAIAVETNCKYINYKGRDAILIYLHDLIERKQNERKILRAIIETEEKQKKHFAEELHDGLGPLVSSIKMGIQFLEEQITEKKHKDILDNILHISEETIKNLREISALLSPHTLKDFGLINALNSFMERTLLHININHTLNTDKFTIQLDYQTELILYRIITELINNTLKHANAQTIIIVIENDNKEVRVCYTDDGKGIIRNASKLKTGQGLLNMKNRMGILNGSFLIQNKEDKGIIAEMKFLHHKK